MSHHVTGQAKRIPSMKRGLVHLALSSHVLGAAALLFVLILGQRAEAMSPLNPGNAPKSIAGGMTIEVRGGGGGGHGGGGMGGWGGGRGAMGPGGVGPSFVHGGMAPGAASPH